MYNNTKELFQSVTKSWNMIFKEYKNVIPYEYVTFINPYSALCNKKGEPIAEYYEDGLHINEKGYQAYTKVIKEVLLNG